MRCLANVLSRTKRINRTMAIIKTAHEVERGKEGDRLHGIEGGEGEGGWRGRGRGLLPAHHIRSRRPRVTESGEMRKL